MIWAAVGAMTTVLLAALGLLSFWVAQAIARQREELADALGGFRRELDTLRAELLGRHLVD